MPILMPPRRVGVDLTPSGDFLKRPFPGSRPPKKRRREEVAPFLTHILALVRPEPPPADEVRQQVDCTCSILDLVAGLIRSAVDVGAALT